MGVLMKFRFLLTLLALPLLGGCLVKPFTPVPGGDYGIENRYAIVRADSLLIILRPQAYNGNVQTVNNNFFTIWLQVRNLGKSPQRLAKESFAIIVEGRQYDFVPLELVLGSIQSNYWLSLTDDPFAVPGTANSQTLTQEQAQEQYFELLNSYFSFGDILPGGSKEGFLFYNRRVDNAKKFSLDALGRQVLFQK